MLSYGRMREGWLFTFITMGDVVKVGHVAVKVYWGLCVWYIHFSHLFNCKTAEPFGKKHPSGIRQSGAKPWVWHWQFWHFCIWHLAFICMFPCIKPIMVVTVEPRNNFFLLQSLGHLMLSSVHLGINFVSKQCNNILF